MGSITGFAPGQIISRQFFRANIAYKAGSSKQSTGSPTARTNSRDVVSISSKGRLASADSLEKTVSTSSKDDSAQIQTQLSAEELRQLGKLKSRDREVKAHEQAHLSAAGQYAGGGAKFTTTKGPDGNSYATGGEVPIDISKESSPAATITKMQTIRRAALAPANPSGADRRIAAEAGKKEAQARKEILAQQQKLLQAGEKKPSSDFTTKEQNTSAISIETAISTYQSIDSLRQTA